MAARGSQANRRGLTEGTGVAILVGFTVLVTASVALNVLVVGDQDAGGVRVNFTYDYVDAAQTLLITHDRGDELPAGNVTIAGENAEVTWAELAGVAPNSTVGPGDAVQISRGNAYGHRVRSNDRIDVYLGSGTDRERLSTWLGPERELGRLAPPAHPLTLHTGNVLATVSPIPRASEIRTTSSTSL